MKKLIAATLLLLTLAGCGANNSMAPVLSSAKNSTVSSSGLFSSFKEASYSPISYHEALTISIDRKDSDKGKKFYLSGNLSIKKDSSQFEPCNISLNGENEYLNLPAIHLSSTKIEAWAAKTGANTDEKVTVFLTAKPSDSDGLTFDAVKRADGTIVKL